MTDFRDSSCASAYDRGIWFHRTPSLQVQVPKWLAHPPPRSGATQSSSYRWLSPESGDMHKFLILSFIVGMSSHSILPEACIARYTVSPSCEFQLSQSALPNLVFSKTTVHVIMG